MGGNPTINLSKSLARQDALEYKLVELQALTNNVMLGQKIYDGEGEEVTVKDLKIALAQVQQALGVESTIEAGWRDQIREEKEARKQQGQLAQG